MVYWLIVLLDPFLLIYITFACFHRSENMSVNNTFLKISFKAKTMLLSHKGNIQAEIPPGTLTFPGCFKIMNKKQNIFLCKMCVVKSSVCHIGEIK